MRIPGFSVPKPVFLRQVLVRGIVFKVPVQEFSQRVQFDELFDRVMPGHPEAVPQRQDLKDLFEKFVRRHIVDFEHLVGIEKQLTYKWGKLKFTGILDRVYLDPDGGTLTVRDLKTDGAIRSQADVDKDFQLSDYAIARGLSSFRLCWAWNQS